MLLTRMVILTGVVVAGITCMFPPYLGRAISPRQDISLPAGYYYVLDLPQSDRFNSGHSEFVISYKLDTHRFYGQLFLVALLTTGFGFALHPRYRLSELAE